MQKAGSSKKKRILIVVALVIIALAIYFGRSMVGGGDAQQQQGGFGVPVETVQVKARPLEVTLDAVGTLAANEQVTLRPEIAGKITDVLFTEGTPVKKGDALFKIDDRMARAELKQAESSLQLARLNNDRFRKLSSTGAATKLRYDEARAELGVNQANADLARTRLEYMTISAPFDGVVGLRNVSPGEYVEVGQELANFVSHDPMKVNFTIPETQASQLAVNQTIEMTVEALPGQKFQGVVYALDPQLDVNGRAALRATIPNPENTLKPGMFARIALTVARKESALTVPESAIVPQGDLKQVFLVDAESKAQLVPVELGERLAGEVEVINGLKEGDVVVTSGQIKLQPGAPVTDLAKMQQQQGQGGQPPAGAPATTQEASPEAAPTEEPAMVETAPALQESAPSGNDATVADETIPESEPVINESAAEAPAQ